MQHSPCFQYIYYRLLGEAGIMEKYERFSGEEAALEDVDFRVRVDSSTLDTDEEINTQNATATGARLQFSDGPMNTQNATPSTVEDGKFVDPAGDRYDPKTPLE